MSRADRIFIDMCKDILENGVSTEGEKVRPHWEDGSSAYTIKKFGVVNRYDLSEEFPAITLRKTAIKSCTDEMLWIWQKKSNNIKDLNSHIWDEWADENGSIGKAYGYQLGVKHQYKEGMMDQVDRVIYDLKNNPFSRRIMTNIYVHQDLHEMNLYPCAYSMTFNVTQKKGEDRLTLNAILNQRSQDILTANNWNVCQYAVLVHMLAQACDMNVGELVHVIADAHIYDRHIPLVEELIQRPVHDAPKFALNPEIKDFYDFTPEDVTVTDYVTGPQIKNIPVAVQLPPKRRKHHEGGAEKHHAEAVRHRGSGAPLQIPLDPERHDRGTGVGLYLFMSTSSEGAGGAMAGGGDGGRVCRVQRHHAFQGGAASLDGSGGALCPIVRRGEHCPY